jgi:hypothetical protein
MEKLALLAAISALPAITFMLIAKINGENKILAQLFIKLPSLISLVSMILIGLSYLGFIKLF